MNVKRILATKGMNVITITADKTLKDAATLLSKQNIGALVVVNQAYKPIGILSERDIVRRAAQQDDVLQLTVGEVMTKDLITGMPQDDLDSVATTMTQRRFRHLPIVDKDKLVGIITLGDIVKAQRDDYRGEVNTLQTQILEGMDQDNS